jgi:hypothetical protein
MAARTAALAAALAVGSSGLALAASPHGDYEGTGSAGTASSFELAGHVVRQVVLVVRVTCNENGTAQPSRLDAVELPGEVRVRADGRFSKRVFSPVATSLLSGRVSGAGAQIAYQARSEVRFPNPFGGGSIHDVCTETMSASAHSASRIAPADGLWRGTAADGESVLFNVTAGGRLVQGVVPVARAGLNPRTEPFTFGTWLTSCSGQTCESAGASRCATQTMGADAFIAPDGTVDTAAFADSNDPPYTIRFASATSAAGTWQPSQPSPVDGQSCDESWTASPAG